MPPRTHAPLAVRLHLPAVSQLGSNMLACSRACKLAPPPTVKGPAEVRCPASCQQPASGPERSPGLLQVTLVMASPVVVLQERVPLHRLRQVLRDTAHSGFPVVQDTPSGKVCPALMPSRGPSVPMCSCCMQCRYRCPVRRRV